MEKPSKEHHSDPLTAILHDILLTLWEITDSEITDSEL